MSGAVHTSSIELRSRIARVIRSSRKTLGYSQTEFAKKIGLNQSALSKIEKGSLSISVETLFCFCEVTGIPADQASHGFIETIERASLKESEDLGLYKLPKKYLYHRGSKMRVCMPIMRYFQKSFGERAFNDYLVSEKIDPDFFVNLDHQISVFFAIDAVKTLVTKGTLKRDGLTHLTKEVCNPTMHGNGKLLRPYRDLSAFKDSIKSLVRMIGFYECNVDYTIEDEGPGHIDLGIKPRWHLDSQKYRHDPVLNDLLCEYRKSWSSDFLQCNSGITVKIEEVECYHKGGSRCLYRYRQGDTPPPP